MRLVVALAAALLLAAAPPAHRSGRVKPLAATTCTLSALKMPFGTYAPLGNNLTTPLEVTGSVGAKCPDGDPYSLTADTGENSAHAGGTCATGACTRALSAGGASSTSYGATSYVPYDLYVDSGYTTVWSATQPISQTGSGVKQTIDIYGYIPPGIASAAGSYTDVVTVTATY